MKRTRKCSHQDCSETATITLIDRFYTAGVEQAGFYDLCRFHAYESRAVVPSPGHEPHQYRPIKTALFVLAALAALYTSALAAPAPRLHTLKQPTSAGSGYVADSKNVIIGQAMGNLANGVLFKTNGIWFVACYNTTGFTVYSAALFASPDCSGQPYYPDVANEPALECGQIVLPPNGGSIIYPDVTKATNINVLSQGEMTPDGTVVDCTFVDYGSLNVAPYTSIVIPTFTPPFHLQ